MGLFDKKVKLDTSVMVQAYDENGEKVDDEFLSNEVNKKDMKLIKRSVKKFDKELNEYDKMFLDYMQLDIDKELEVHNERYNKGKIKIFDKNLSRGMTVQEMADVSGDYGLMAIIGNKQAGKLSVGAKLAGAFQPFFEEQAKKHPGLQKLSDSVTKAANGGRMPLTEQSAAMMRIAFDKKYYNDLRDPNVDNKQAAENYQKAIRNLGLAAAIDGVDPERMSKAYSRKIIVQMQMDPSLEGVYDGLITQKMAIAADKKTGKFYSHFRSVETGKEIDAWNEFTVRKPQSLDEILADHKARYNKVLESDKYNGHNGVGAPETTYYSSSGLQLELCAKEGLARKLALYDCPEDAQALDNALKLTQVQGKIDWYERNGYGNNEGIVRLKEAYGIAEEQNAKVDTSEYVLDKEVENVVTPSEKVIEDVKPLTTNAEIEQYAKESIENDTQEMDDIAEACKLFSEMTDEEIGEYIADVHNRSEATYAAFNEYDATIKAGMEESGKNAASIDPNYDSVLDSALKDTEMYDRFGKALDAEAQKRGYGSSRYEMLEALKSSVNENQNSNGYTIIDADSPEGVALQKQIAKEQFKMDDGFADFMFDGKKLEAEHKAAATQVEAEEPVKTEPVVETPAVEPFAVETPEVKTEAVAQVETPETQSASRKSALTMAVMGMKDDVPQNDGHGGHGGLGE